MAQPVPTPVFITRIPADTAARIRRTAPAPRAGSPGPADDVRR